jgi:hypothetical protein
MQPNQFGEVVSCQVTHLGFAHVRSGRLLGVSGSQVNMLCVASSLSTRLPFFGSSSLPLHSSVCHQSGLCIWIGLTVTIQIDLG